MHRLRLHLKDESGQALVEFALVIPILLLVMLAVLHFGKAINYWNDATHITAEGARYAAVNRKPNPGNAQSLQAQLLAQADSTELKSGGSDSIPTAAQVCVEYPNGTSAIGDPVRVRMRFTYHWMGFISGFLPSKVSSTTIESTSVMRLETPPTNYSAGCA
jgi:Flp pilus assembly protein TadG